MDLKRVGPTLGRRMDLKCVGLTYWAVDGLEVCWTNNRGGWQWLDCLEKQFAELLEFVWRVCKLGYRVWRRLYIAGTSCWVVFM